MTKKKKLNVVAILA